ncbi:tetratricopeptide repeat protein [Nostoc sp. FACHB-892]|uniref:serine/threonine-protein kinase n=1 Tax=Nostoc sp. FACHB-892 TaxID=2692843 RepID=UPI001686C824|nr:serine/threonine-protein kinase [Nostoc sp. FACHB-892]MBD2730409.1 tetratricopeptide repeat protein [Nostoc sp. FACHB-892]
MGYCINPLCKQRQNPDDVNQCLFCGTSLLINDRICLVKPLRELTENPFNYTEVFEVDDTGTQWNPGCKRRVMKVLKWNTPKLVDLIERESLTLRLIEHPCIPKSTIDDFFTFIPNNSSLILHCLIMDKFEGENLEQWLESNGRISQSVALQWLRQLVEILDEVHRTEFFHRDIKPSNIILQSSGQLALIDFGVARRVTDTYLAKVSGSGGSNTGRGGRYEITSVSTPRYSPLEQVNGQAVPQSDFYALGRTLVQLLTGIQLMDLPIDKKTGNLIWRDKAPQIDNPFADFIEELMAPLPGQRPQTTKVILQRLEGLPFKSKINRIVKSKLFLISAGITFALTLVALGYASLPVIANSYLNQGKKAHKENRFIDAESDFNAAIKYNSNLTDSVSEFYFDQGDRHEDKPELARKNYELAIKFNPKNVSAYNNLALICQEMYDLSCIESTYQIIFKLQPKMWEARYGLGSFYDDHGKYDLAEQEYKLAIQSSEQSIPAVNNLSRLKNIIGDYSAAEALALQGLQKGKDPEVQASLYKNLGWALLEQKRYAEAKTNLQKSTELDPERTDAYCLLAQVQEALNIRSKAKMYWEFCLILNSSLPEVQKWREQILERVLNKY